MSLSGDNITKPPNKTDTKFSMLSIQEFKNILGEKAQKYSDQEIEQIRDTQYNLAEIIFEQWSEEKNRAETTANIVKILIKNYNHVKFNLLIQFFKNVGGLLYSLP